MSHFAKILLMCQYREGQTEGKHCLYMLNLILICDMVKHKHEHCSTLQQAITRVKKSRRGVLVRLLGPKT